MENDDFILVTSRRNRRRKRQPPYRSITDWNQHHRIINRLSNRRPYVRHRRPPYCGNCGTYGHVYRECREPFTSLGIIAFRASKHDTETQPEIQNVLDSLPDVVTSENDDKFPIRVLMVQRRDSLGYINILRPRQEENNAFINTYAQDMTPKERKRLEDREFKDLWTDLAMNKQCRRWYSREMERAQDKFDRLDLYSLLDNTTSKWNHLEWGFPKGKRNLYEEDLCSALREFQEETGYSQKDLTLIQKEPLIERFIGLNDNEYMCKYFIAWMNPERLGPEIDQDNPYQAGEISNLAWLTYNEAMKIIRPNAKNKRDILKQAYRLCLENDATKN